MLCSQKERTRRELTKLNAKDVICAWSGKAKQFVTSFQYLIPILHSNTSFMTNVAYRTFKCTSAINTVWWMAHNVREDRIGQYASTGSSSTWLSLQLLLNCHLWISHPLRPMWDSWLSRGPCDHQLWIGAMEELIKQCDLTLLCDVLVCLCVCVSIPALCVCMHVSVCLCVGFESCDVSSLCINIVWNYHLFIIDVTLATLS